MAINISELSEQVNVADDDVLHLRTVGGIDRKITGTNLVKDFNDRSGDIVELPISTNMNAGEPVCLFGGHYGKYKIEELVAETQIFTDTDQPYGIEITKDYTTGKIGFVAISEDKCRIGEIDSDGESISFLTTEVTFASTNPSDGVSTSFRSLVHLEDSAGRHRFLVGWNSGSAPGVPYVRVGEWDGSVGITWLTAEQALSSYGLLSRFGSSILLEDKEHIVLYGARLNGVQAIGLHWDSSTNTITELITVAQLTTNNGDYPILGDKLGYGLRFGVYIYQLSSTSVIGVWELDTVTPGFNLVCDYSTDGTVRSGMGSGGHSSLPQMVRGGFHGDFWRVMCFNAGNSAVLNVDAGRTLDDDRPHQTVRERQATTGSAVDGVTSSIQYVIFKEDKFDGYGGVFYTDTSVVGTLYFGRWAKNDWYGLKKELQIFPGGGADNDVRNTALDVRWGLAVVEYRKAPEGAGVPAYYRAYRLPKCIGVILEDVSAGNNARVLLGGGAEFSSGLDDGTYTYDLVAGEWVHAPMPWDVKLTVRGNRHWITSNIGA